MLPPWTLVHIWHRLCILSSKQLRRDWGNSVPFVSHCDFGVPIWFEKGSIFEQLVYRKHPRRFLKSGEKASHTIRSISTPVSSRDTSSILCGRVLLSIVNINFELIAPWIEPWRTSVQYHCDSNMWPGILKLCLTSAHTITSKPRLSISWTFWWWEGVPLPFDTWWGQELLFMM